MIPQIPSTDVTTELTSIPSKTYKLQITEYDETPAHIQGFVDKLDAIKQAVYHILATERYAYLIYSENYGVELAQYIGNTFDYLEANIESTLKDALTYDLRIKDVVVNSIEKKNTDEARIKFTVYSIYGDIQMEVAVSV